MEENKSYTLRKLQASDTFTVATIISKVGIKKIKNCLKTDEIKLLIADNKKKSDDENGSKDEFDFGAIGVGVALEIAGVILESLEQCQNEIYTLLSHLSGMKVKDIQTLDFDIFFEMIVDVVKGNSKAFMRVASRLFK